MTDAPAVGTLHLIPVTLGGDDPLAVIPATVLAVAATLDYFIVENEKSARRFLKLACYPRPLPGIAMRRLDEHTTSAQAATLLEPLFAGHNVGLLSEAGCPAIADPGARVAALAHQHRIRVVPHVGPSSIALALMASGMSGQHFAFHGYLPVENEPRGRRLRELERQSRRDGITQIFIETPYRNDRLLAAIVETCAPTTRLCLATDLTLATETVRTQPLSVWVQQLPDLRRRPTVFLLAAG